MRVVLPAVAALGAGSAIAISSVPDSHGVIHGCYPASTSTSGVVTPTANATLRIIDPEQGQACNPNEGPRTEAALDFNQSGPTGTAGATGQPGAGGQQGNPGPPGGNGGTTITPPRNASVFLKLTGIRGESTDAKHKGEIQLDSFSFGANRGGGGGGSLGGGGGVAGKAHFQTFAFTKSHDVSSPKLLQAVVDGQNIKKARVSVDGNGPNGGELLRYDLGNVVVDSFHETGGGAGTEDKVGLVFSKVSVTFSAVDGTTIKGGFFPTFGKF